jgi:hypothetical protein
MMRVLSMTGLAVGILALVAVAQTPEVSPDEAKQLESLNQQAPVSQAPGEDVMRPTQHGIRLTPRLARGIAGAWVSEMVEKDLGASLVEDQKNKLTETMARRMMEMGNKYGTKTGPFFESAFEFMGPGRNDMTPEKAKEFGKQAKETVPVWREFFGTMTEDFRPYLNAEQLAELEKKQKQIGKAIDRFDERMGRWSNGEMKDKEEPFEDLDKPDEEEAKNASGDAKAKKDPEVKTAERRAAWAMRSVDPSTWREFLVQVRNTFKLTDEQYARGQELLKGYVARAKVITTPEWREKVRKNRLLKNMGDVLRTASPAPWVYHLDREYDEMVKPLEEMQKAFRLEVLGLVTREQRDAVIAELREFAAKHGMTADEADIRFPTTQPE